MIFYESSKEHVSAMKLSRLTDPSPVYRAISFARARATPWYLGHGLLRTLNATVVLDLTMIITHAVRAYKNTDCIRFPFSDFNSFNSLFKVSFTFHSWYLFVIGLEPILSFRWYLPPTLRYWSAPLPGFHKLASTKRASMFARVALSAPPRNNDTSYIRWLKKNKAYDN